MAAEPAKKAANVQPIKPKKSGKLLLWITLAVVVLGGSAAGAWWMLKGAPAGADSAKPAPAPRAAPVYYKFDPAFVVNFGGEGSARYLQVTLEVMSRDQPILDTLKDNEPAVRNDLVLLFSSQDNATLMTIAGKEKLRAQTLATIRKVLTDIGANGSLIEQAYFTSFVIQ